MDFNQLEFLLTISKRNTPIFNKSIFNSFDKKGHYLLKFDERFLIRSLETIVYPNTPLNVIDTLDFKHMKFCKITCKDYPSKKELFVNAENIAIGKECKRKCPSLSQIQKKLRSLKSIPYFWGGTLPYSLEKADELFKNIKPLTPFEKKCISFEGLDCSGLLYHVTNGYTPRNTSHLMNFGKPCKDLKPLDLILWPGHVVLVLDDKKTIESREFDGLVTEPIEKRLHEIRSKRRWVKNIRPGSLAKNIFTTRRFL